jgi:AcrR family transcriptional regulator
MFHLQLIAMTNPKETQAEPEQGSARPLRADAQRKLAALLQAATEVFATSGVDAPVREIAQRAGVGLGTVYRHFPQRADLIAAVMRTQVDACADAAPVFAAQCEPGEALTRWLHRFMDFLGTKRGLATALHSGDPTYSALPGYFLGRMFTALGTLLDTAAAARVIRAGVVPQDLLFAVANLCQGPNGQEPPYAREMVRVLVDGLRYGAGQPSHPGESPRPA